MLMHEYLDALSEQIRCKKARPLVVEEIRGHIEDQAESFEKDGMDKNLALEKAVAEMGDPIQTGVELDRIHRPKMQWSIIGMAALLSLFGMIMQIVIFNAGTLSNDINVTTIRDSYIINSVIFTVIGLAVMIGVCMIDYTFLGKYPKVLWFVMCALLLIIIYLCDSTAIFSGTFLFSYMFSYRIRYFYSTLMIPVYAAVTYRCRNHKMSGFFGCIGFLLLGVFTTAFAPVSSKIEFNICTLIILTVAILKNWFVTVSDTKVFLKKTVQLCILWIPALVIPLWIVITALFFGNKTTLLASYQVARIKAMFGMLENADTTVSYVTTSVRNVLSGATFLGEQELPLTTIPAIQNDYIITGMISYFGIGFTTLILILMGAFLLKAFRVSTKQKNQLGSIISTGCASELLVKTLIYIGANLGLQMPFAQMSMPFLSYGLMNTVMNAVLTGLLLSVFRNTDIISEKMIKPKYTFRSPIQKVE